jgi:hypothetical protein
MQETLETAARRVIRFIRIDDNMHGGLLSRDSITAVDTLDKQLRLATRSRGKDEDVVRAEEQPNG